MQVAATSSVRPVCNLHLLYRGYVTPPFYLSFSLFGEMELVRLVEHLSYLINLKEGSSARVAESEATAQIGNFVVKCDISLLSKHAKCCRKHIVRRNLVLLVDGDDTEAQIQPALRLLIIADCKNRVRSTEGSKMTYRLARQTVGDDTGNTELACSVDGSVSQELLASSSRSSAPRTLP